MLPDIFVFRLRCEHGLERFLRVFAEKRATFLERDHRFGSSSCASEWIHGCHLAELSISMAVLSSASHREEVVMVNLFLSSRQTFFFVL